MTEKPASQPITFIDNPHAPEVLADECTGVMLHGGVLRMTFEAARVNHVTSPGPVNRVVIGRVAMPLDGAKRLRDLLVDYLGKIEAGSANVPPQGTTIQ